MSYYCMNIADNCRDLPDRPPSNTALCQMQKSMPLSSSVSAKRVRNTTTYNSSSVSWYCSGNGGMRKMNS
jgi:hypothetical protein